MKRVKRLVWACLLVGMASQHSFAQSGGHWEAEVDPSTYFLKGYSVHLGYQTGKSRFNIGSYAFELPGFISGTDGFKQKNTALQAKYDYLFSGVKGWYLGGQLDLTRKNVTLKETGTDADFDRLVVGARIGYRFMLGSAENDYRGFYLSPWAGVLYNLHPIETTLAGVGYKERQAIPFAALHLGWRF